jgi:hypothetical protein
LWVGDNQKNVDDMVAKKRHPRRTTHGMARLTEADVFAIRVSSATGVTLARVYQVSTSAISDIRTGRSWTERI